ncbi:MAG TPA: ribonuclease III [Patescibacteria group bacterium]|nr:ribonuclease III [Patescibacteria group bacterium]
MNPPDLAPLQKSLGYDFQDPTLLATALTHRSSLNEQGVKESNERLEFLGDAVLEMIITNYLYQARPNESEGFLTAARSAVVRTEGLAEVARSINLGSYLRMSRGEVMGGGRENPSLLENTVEALIGAIFKDGGLERASDFITRFIVPQAQRVLSKNELKDAKSLYQEKIQSLGLLSPAYKVMSQEGPDHNKIFEVAVFVDNQETGRGHGKSKQEAEQQAAQMALGVTNKP